MYETDSEMTNMIEGKLTADSEQMTKPLLNMGMVWLGSIDFDEIDSLSLLARFSFPIILPPSVALGDWCQSRQSQYCQVMPCPCSREFLVICSLSVVSLPSIMLVIPDSVSYITLHFGLLQNIFDCVSCRWWGTHHDPPSTSLFLLTSTPYPGIRLRNQYKYLGPACLNDRLPHFQHEFTSLSLD